LNITGAQIANVGNYSVVITNSAGSTNSTAAALAVSAPPSLVSGPGAIGGLQLSATTIPGLNYIVEIASNLGPASVWVPITTNIVPPSGVLLFTTNSAADPAQFFRVQFP
jgi:hypothetical protein